MPAGQGWYPSQQVCAGDAETMVKDPEPWDLVSKGGWIFTQDPS